MYRVERKEIFIKSKETLSYRFRQGGSDIIILLHDNYASSRNFDFLLETISEQYTLYAIDLRGFGNSSYLTPIRSIKDLAKDVDYFTDAIGINRFALLGWGLGGLVALDYALNNPSKMNQLILLGSYAFTNSNAVEACSSISQKNVDDIETWKQNGNDRRLKKHLIKTHYHKNKPPKGRLQYYLREMKMQRNLEDIVRVCHRYRFDKARLKQVQVKTLMIHGEKDKTVPIKLANNLRSSLGENTKMITLKNGDHAVMMGTLGETLKHIETFLAEKNPS